MPSRDDYREFECRVDEIRSGDTILNLPTQGDEQVVVAIEPRIKVICGHWYCILPETQKLRIRRPLDDPSRPL